MNELLAGLTVGTIISLKHAELEDFKITHSHKDGKYAGWITTLEGRPVVNTDLIFYSSVDAENHMRRVHDAAKAWETAAAVA